MYQVGRSVYVYDMETQETKKLFTHGRNGNSTTICFWTAMRSSCAELETPCNAWAVDLADNSVIELDTRGERDAVLCAL